MSDTSQTRPLRPLLPAYPPTPTTPDDAPPVAHAPPVVPITQHQRAGIMSKTTDRPTRQQIAAACTNCQRKKCKCDGEKPCRPCKKHSLNCNYTYEAGVTRSRALKRKNEALSEDNVQLRFIVQGLRGGSEEEAREILKRIRESHDVDAAISHINQAALLLPPTTDSVGSRSDNVTDRNREHSMISASTSPVSKRAPTLALDFLLNPVIDEPQQMVNINRPAVPYPFQTLARVTNDHNATHSETTTSSSAPSERDNSRDLKHVPLLRWVPFESVPEVSSRGADFPGTADRLNALLDGLPFLLTRPQTPSPVVSISQLGTYLPVISVSARPWTNVTDDDEFTSQLISLFFTWEQPWYTYVEMNSFLDDMKSGTYNSSSGPPPEREFCSSSLVNAIMAMGSLSSRHPSAYVVPGEASTRGRHFLIEAERLIRLEMGRPKLTTLQAMWLVMWYRSCSGYKFRSSEFNNAFYEAYERLGLAEKIPRPWDYDSNPKSRMSFDSKSEIIWGIYCHDTTLAIANGSPSQIQRPRIERTFERDIPQDQTLTASHLWWPYPEPAIPQNSLRHECLTAKVYLTDICHHIFAFLDATPAGPSTEGEYAQRVSHAMTIYRVLVAWREALPEALGPQGSILPHVILLRASHDIAVISLFRSLQHSPGGLESASTQPRFKVLSHSQSLMGTMTTLRDKWSLFRHCYAMQIHWLTAFALLFHLRIGEPIADVFTTSIVGLCEVGEKWPVAAWMLQIVSLMAQHFELELPKNCLKWLDFNTVRSLDENSSDMMLPVTIPNEMNSQHPLLEDLQVGTYLNNVHSVLDKLQNTKMAE